MVPLSNTQDTTETPQLPGDGLRESIVDDLRRHIGEGLLEFLLKPQDDLWIRIAADAWAATGRALRSMGFEYFCFLSAIDWKPSPFGRGEDDPTQPPPERTTEVRQGYAGGATRFQVLARVTDTKRHVGVTLKVDVDPDDDGALAIDSWHAFYAGANWHERETHEMYGIAFTGHPDPRNIYLPTDFEGYPLRKDFPLLARMVKPWPGIVDVEPMPMEEVADDDVGANADASVGGGVSGGADPPANAEAPAAAGQPAVPAVDAALTEGGVDAATGAGVTVVEEAPEAGGVAVADGSDEFVSDDGTESVVSADTNPDAASLSDEVTESVASADTDPESVAPPSAEGVEAAADAAAEEARTADEAAEDTATAETADVEAVPIESGVAEAASPTDPASTEDAGPQSEAAEHPESATEPADATEETVADAPDHSDLESASGAASHIPVDADHAGDFASGDVTESGLSADVDGAGNFASGNVTESGAPADTNASNASDDGDAS